MAQGEGPMTRRLVPVGPAPPGDHHPENQANQARPRKGAQEEKHPHRIHARRVQLAEQARWRHLQVACQRLAGWTWEDITAYQRKWGWWP